MKLYWLVALAGLASCTKKNPDLCCTTDEDCASVGLANGTGCSDGLACIGHGCVAEQCNTAADCPMSQPICRAGVCGVCDEANACPAAMPVCDLDNLTCGGCGGDGDCATFESQPFCDIGTGACVACTTASQCPTAKPLCTDNSCVACAKHSDCPSNVCLPDGSCGSDADTAYVTAGAADNPLCTKASPCGTIAAGLATLRPNMKMSGALTGDVAPTQDMIIVADPGTTVTPPATADGALATFQAAIIGPGSKNLSLDISDVRVFANSNHAPFFGGNFTLRRVIAADGPGGAISCAALTMLDSVITNFKFGGIQTDGPVTIRNSIITRNGSTAAVVQLGGLVLQAGPVSIEFSTIADNFVPASGQANKSGITCTSPMAIGKNNIVTGNVIDPQCALDYSLFDALPAAGVNNKAGSPSFKSVTFVDPLPVTYYRLAAGSIGVDTADPASDPLPDIDGVIRPQGAGFDMGASEYKP